METDVLVVGGGPAGLSAARAARLAGARVLLVDEHAAVGGRRYRDPEVSGVRDPAGVELAQQVAAAGVEILAGTAIWGVADDGAMHAAGDGRRSTIRWRAMVLAPGSDEVAMPFRGWTLPGVITTSDVRPLAADLRRPGRRVLVAGSGPALLETADELLRAGVPVVGLVEAARDTSPARRDLQLARLPAGRVPVCDGAMVIAAEGESRVERAVVADLDDEGRPRPGTERRFDVDTVVVSAGFVPSTRLARLVGCAVDRSDSGPGRQVRHDADLQTSVPGVFVAGSAAGHAGHGYAIASGRLAGMGAAGRPVAAGVLAGAAAEVRRQRAVDEVMAQAFAVPPALFAAVADDVVVCRCEDVTAGRVRAVLRSWNRDLRTIRGVTRVGMGTCQGRMCELAVAGLVAGPDGADLGTAGAFGVRAPVSPVPVDAIAMSATSPDDAA